MDFIFVTGKLGQGKTLVSVSRIKERIERGCTVATNVDINLLKMFHPKTDKPRLIRIPDKPTLEDFELIGTGYDQSKGYDESNNGLLVLDECGTWFNARNWQDKTRQGVNNWFLHARKLGWDVFLIVQDISIIDSQARESLAAGVARCKRLDKIRLPIIGPLSKTFLGYEIRPPKLHVARVEDDCGILLDRWTYRGTDLYKAYDTRQAFKSDYPHFVHSVLTPWHTHGRYLRPQKDRLMRLTKIHLKRFSRVYLFALGLFSGSLISLYQSYRLTAPLNPQTSTPHNQSTHQTNNPDPEPPKPLKDQFGGWSYDGSQSINRSNVFFFVNPEGIRIPSTDSLFEGITLSEPSSCAAKLQIGKDFVYLKCKPTNYPPPDSISQPKESVAQSG